MRRVPTLSRHVRRVPKCDSTRRVTTTAAGPATWHRSLTRPSAATSSAPTAALEAAVPALRRPAGPPPAPAEAPARSGAGGCLAASGSSADQVTAAGPRRNLAQGSNTSRFTAPWMRIIRENFDCS